MKKRIIAAVTALTLLLSCALAEAAPAFAVVGLKTQGRVNPFGIDVRQPAFSWRMESSAIGAAQTAWRIVVTDEEGDVAWDSGEVEGAASSGILYGGEALAPSTTYTWRVTVTDNAGTSVESAPAAFTTALMSDSFDAWDGAQWIGLPVLPLDAASKSVFHINADVTLTEGDAYSFILGANDFRLKNPAFNPKGLAGENYVRVEVDLSGLTEAGGARINVYRVGYDPGDDGSVPFATVGESEELDALLTAADKYAPHHVDIFCTNSTLTFTVDGVVVNATPVTVAEMGNCYPHLNGVGFAMNPGESATFANYRIENGGKFARGVLFDMTMGSVISGDDWGWEDGEVTVDGGEDGVLYYADPTHGAAPMLRADFDAKAGIDRAYLYVTAQGIYNYYINGEEIAPDEWFNPGSTEYDAILGYNMYDVTDFLAEGANAMGAVLGEGWWTGMATFEPTNNNYYGDQPALMAKLVIDYADGTSDTIVTDEKWECCDAGPVRLASLFQGERYDATAENLYDGFTAGGDRFFWEPAAVIPTRKQFASPRLVTRYDAPVHVIRELTAAECLGEPREGSGSCIYDMGENLVGVPEITIPAEYAKAGETLTIRYAEILYPELPEYDEQGVQGMLMVENLRSALATDFYTMKDGGQTFCPDLTFHGYRYIEITGLDRPLPAECVGMKVLSSLDASATYESSSELTNRLFANIVNSTTGNYLSIPTDCPQRDERMGWTGDAQVYALSASYVADTCAFMRQWMDTVRADCGENGMSSQYCPAFVAYDIDSDEAVPHSGQSFGITWNCLVVTIPYNLYLQTGDPAIVRDNIDNIRAYVDHLIDTPLSYKDENKEKHTEPRLTGETGTLCDHLARVPTDGVSLGNAVFIACLDEAAVMADAVGDADTARRYRDAAAAARQAWNELFIDAETGMTKNAKGVIQDTQASYATPLRFGVISEENRPKALEHYLRTLAEPNLTDADGLDVPPYSITTGFNATGNVLPALSMNGMSDTAYRLFESTDYASWLYPVTQGATSIWERWNGYTNALGFNGNNSMNSFNHYSFGAVFEWMMAYQLGIQADPACPGYQHFILQPTVGGEFTFAKGSYDSAYGPISSGWTAEAGSLTGYDCAVPANTTATLYLPAQGDVETCEGVTLAGETTHNGVRVLRLELVSGTYHFDIAGGSVTASAA